MAFAEWLKLKVGAFRVTGTVFNLGKKIMEVLITILVVTVYGAGGWKFWKGFRRTNFDPSASNRIRLTLLWPALIVNKSYRKNFQKALKG